MAEFLLAKLSFLFDFDVDEDNIPVSSYFISVYIIEGCFP